MWTKVPISECYNNTGKAPIGTRWVDINKGDDNEPDYRSRSVGKDFKGNDNKRNDLFAATPPLEAKRTLFALAASQCGTHGITKKLSFVDIRKAYFMLRRPDSFMSNYLMKPLSPMKGAKYVVSLIIVFMVAVIQRIIGKMRTQT